MSKSVVIVVAASAALAGCHAEAEYSGPDVSRTYQVAGFHEIEVRGPYDVQVRTGANPGVSGRGPEKLLEKTRVEVEGDKLVIGADRERSWFGFGSRSHGKASFVVTVPQLSGATIAGSGDIKVDHVAGDQFEGTVAGSGGLDVGDLKVQQLKLTIAGSGGAKAHGGTAQSAEFEIAGSGDVDAGGVQAQTAKASIAGSGSIRAQAKVTADVDIMGSGDVDISGGAKCTISKAGSGNVRCS